MKKQCLINNKFTWKPIDLFFGVNVLLFLGLCVFRYYHRFIKFRGSENIHEFFIYATALMISIALLWRYFRHSDLPGLLLLLVQAGILLHFFGAFMIVDGHRLYDAFILGVRYDKYVHFTNAFVACVFLQRLFVTEKFPLTRLGFLIIVLSTLGLGALVEILEYWVVKTVPHNGVGDYDNNLQDLFSNLLGCLVFAGTRRLTKRGCSSD